jgi:hypothetical protein
MRAWFIHSTAALLFAAQSYGATDGPNPKSKQCVDELLAFDPPARKWQDFLRETPCRAAKPAADASRDALIEYWNWAAADNHPDEATLARFLELVEKRPADFDFFSRFFPEHPETFADRIKALYDRLYAIHTPQAAQTAEVMHDWLVHHSRYFREKLIARALPSGYWRRDEKDPDWRDLLRLDAPQARKILAERVKQPDVVVRATSLTVLRENFDDPGADREWLAELKQIAVDPAQSKDAREQALEGAVVRPWPGWEDWFAGRGGDEKLGRDPANPYASAPLDQCAGAMPNRLIPVLSGMVASSNPIVHRNAVAALTQFHENKTRKDALQLLLPWIADASWAPDLTKSEREQMLKDLTRVDLPECVPLLRQAVKTAPPDDLELIAKALAHYHVTESAPDLRARLKDSVSISLWEALTDLAALSPSEVSQALELFAQNRKGMRPRKALAKWRDYGEPVEPPNAAAAIVLRLLEAKNLNDESARAALEAAARVEKKSLNAAEIIRCVLARWAAPASDTEAVARLRNGKVTSDWIEQLLSRRTSLEKVLRDVTGLHGLPLGLQAALSGDEMQCKNVLAGNDREAQCALLACARLTGGALPVDLVAILMNGPDRLVSRAAILYLIAIDSKETQAALKTAKTGRHYISGEVNGAVVRDNVLMPMVGGEKEASDWIKKSPAGSEIFSLGLGCAWGGGSDCLLLHSAKEDMLRCFDGNGRVRERALPAEAVAHFKEWLQLRSIDSLPPYHSGWHDASEYDFLHLTANGGHRVYMNMPPSGADFGWEDGAPTPAVYGEIVRRFVDLETAAPLTVNYPALNAISGFRILHTKENGEVVAIAQGHGSWRARVSFRHDRPDDSRTIAPDGLASDAVPEPLPADLPNELIGSQDDSVAVSVKTGPIRGKRVWAGSPGSRGDGLWIVSPEGGLEMLVAGEYRRPVFSGDGNWLVSVRHGDNVCRINVVTKEVNLVALPPADLVAPVVWLEHHRRVLVIRRAFDDAPHSLGPKHPQFHLLEPSSGNVARISGDFAPLVDTYWPSSTNVEGELQPTDRANEFWAVKQSQPKPPLYMSIFGRYDAVRFQFHPLLELPGLKVRSSEVRVDEKTSSVFMTVNGDLLRFDLPADKPALPTVNR